MSNTNYKPKGASFDSQNYRFNIARNCPICNKSFITDLFHEEDMCKRCEDIYQVIPSIDDEFYLEDVSDIIDSLVSPSGRAKVYRYD